MYLEYYGLSRLPFQITPDVRFYYGSRAHNRALATMTYGLSKCEGFVVITGEVGAGKTTLIEYLLASGRLGDRVTARINTTQLESENLLQLIVFAFGHKSAGTGKAENLRELNDLFLRLFNSGRRALLIVDEVQNLSRDALEELRMLSNFQNREEPLLQMLLVGQPEFRFRLGSPACEQIRQRVIASYHLSPLPEADVRKYIEHRLTLAGWDGEELFTSGAYRRIQEATRGVPRKVNRLCDRLLLYGYLEDTRRIDEAAAHEVIDEMRMESLAGPPEPQVPDGDAASANGSQSDVAREEYAEPSPDTPSEARRHIPGDTPGDTHDDPDGDTSSETPACALAGGPLRLYAPADGSSCPRETPSVREGMVRDVENLRSELALYRGKLSRVVDYVARAERRLRGGMN